MSGLVGKGVRSYKKAIVSDSNFPALGFRNFIMAFQANAMGVGAGGSVSLVNFPMTVTVPPEMVAAGFEQPDPIEIGNAQLGNFRNNVIVTSNLNGILIDRVSYTLTNDSITFDDGLNANEIIVIKRGNEAVTGNRVVDARPLRASGTVDFSMIGSSPVIFEVGEGFRIAPSTLATGGIDNRQIGFVQVFADGVLQARNVGNNDESMLPASEQTGNYREVIVDGLGALLATQNGVTANAIEFNQFQPFSSMEGVIVISTNLIVDSPNNTGVIDQLSTLQAQITANQTELATIPDANTGAIAQELRVNAGQTAYELFTPSSAAAGILSITTYELGIGTSYTIPDDATAIEVEGAAGGSGGSNAGNGDGGGAGEWNTRYVDLNGTGTSRALTVAIGSGGASNGGDGGATSISGTITSTGGSVTINESWAINAVGGDTGSARTSISTSGSTRGNSGGCNRKRGGNGNDISGFVGPAGGGSGWVEGGNAPNGSTGGTGGHGGMIVKALGITVTAGT